MSKARRIRPENGELYRFKRRKDGSVCFYDVCCDCGLRHFNQVRSVKTAIVFRTWRDDKGTKLERQKRKR